MKGVEPKRYRRNSGPTLHRSKRLLLDWTDWLTEKPFAFVYITLVKMPRVTRRSVAAKEDSTPEESPRTTSRGRRSATKKEEPKEEEVAIGEPRDATPKRGGRQAKAKEPETKTPDSKEKTTPKSRGRGRRGKDVVENEEEEEDKKEEEPKEMEKTEDAAKEPQGRGRGRNRSSNVSAAKTEASTSRSSSRPTRGRAAKEEETPPTEDKSVVEEKTVEESPTTTKSRGGRSRGKAKVETTPSPRPGRSSRRGRSAADEEKEKMETADTEEGKEEQEAQEDPVPASSKGEVEAESKKEASVPEPDSEKQSQEAKNLTPASKGTEEEVKTQEEPMDTAETKADESLPNKKTTESPKSTTPTKKRKLADDDNKTPAKKSKTEEEETSNTKDLSDYVVINKEDVPEADSKEVLDCVPKLPETPSEPQAPAEMETEASDSAEIVPPSKDGEPVIVPLTEAELAKQYSQSQVDRDEASSTLVEVGSEGATDTTAMSVRSLDVSDAVSMDSVSTTDDSAINPAGQRAATPSTDGKPVSAAATPTESPAPQQKDKEAKSTTSTEVKNSPAKEEVKSSSIQEIAKSSPVQEEVKGSSVQETAKSSPVQEEVKSPPVEPKVNQNNVKHSSEPVNSVPPVAQSEPSSVPTVPAESPVVTSTAAVATDPADQITRNGNGESPSKKNTSENSNPDAISKSPVKQALNAAPVNYTPSSTAIDKRKFVQNPNFPLDLMDPAFSFSVVSYNILAECHWKRGDYSFTPAEFMELDYRHSLLLKELDYLKGDIVCLQEVEPQYYKDTLLPAMTARGYSGSFLKRTQEYYAEGEATFVKSSRFIVKSSEGISLKDLAYKEVDESGLSSEVSAAVKQYLDRADIIMLTQLECVKTGKTLTVANIHVVYAPPAPDVQCIQIACAIKQLVAKAGNDLSPHIICGDFNSKVTMAGYQLAKDGYLSDEHIRTLQALEALTNTDGSSRSLIHHLWKAFQHTSSNLKSAYEVAMTKEPLYTSYTDHEHGCLDYVFFSSASLDNVGVLEALDPAVINAMPSAAIPSDHLSLKAVFRMK
ncbi:glucose-repressible alcohol dehydrogenase transcriptional effector [Elysia marginata]|uniref:Glucose-repressible alcohol dehydrogenase transcriptional effector n=1 Tax=Elysia marginata TaxID=1093978 RepID=A0AAV4JWG4_9GAST|nr:glucose-repressible alcohol dehydrogenase transcriptional effector [Elysia marginata]